MPEDADLTARVEAEIAQDRENLAAEAVQDGLDADADADLATVWQDFHTAVTMTSRELRDHLTASAAPQDALGYRVLDVLTKRRTDVSEHDAVVMRTVVDLVAAENPDPDAGDLSDDAWRLRLLDVGHDPARARAT